MIIDVTQIPLTPGNNGEDCLGNGEHYDENGKIIECCCDECDYLMCCTNFNGLPDCSTCKDADCPRANQKSPVA